MHMGDTSCIRSCAVDVGAGLARFLGPAEHPVAGGPDAVARRRLQVGVLLERLVQLVEERALGPAVVDVGPQPRLEGGPRARARSAPGRPSRPAGPRRRGRPLRPRRCASGSAGRGCPHRRRPAWRWPPSTPRRPGRRRPCGPRRPGARSCAGRPPALAGRLAPRRSLPSCWPLTALAPPLNLLSRNFWPKVLQNGGTLRILSGGSFRFASQNTSGKAEVNGPSVKSPASAERVAPPPLRGSRRHPHRPADGGARRHHRQRRPAPHPAQPRLLELVAVVGAQRLRPHLRRPAPARRPIGRPARPAPDLPGRDRPVLPELAGRRASPPPAGCCSAPGPCRGWAAPWPHRPPWPC